MMDGATVAIVTGIISAMLYDVLKFFSKIIISKAIQMAATTEPSRKSLILNLMRDISVVLALVWLLWDMPSDIDKSGVILVAFCVIGICVEVLFIAWYFYLLKIAHRVR